MPRQSTRGSTRGGSRKRSGKITVDFTDVEDIWLPPEEIFAVKVAKMELTESSNGNDQFETTFEVLDGKYEGKRFKYWFSLVPEALWKIRTFLIEGLGDDVPNSSYEIDPESYIDAELGVEITHREYEGRKRVEISQFMLVDDVSEKEPEPPPRRGRGRPRKEEAAEPETRRGRTTNGSGERRSSKVAEAEVRDMDSEQMEELVDKFKLKVDLSKFRGAAKKADALVDALDAGGHLA